MSLGSILSSVAPTIEAALTMTGPYGAIASMAVKAVSNILTPNDPNPTPEKLMASLPTATPEQLLALQQADNTLKVQLQQLNVDVIKIKADLEAKEDEDATQNTINARNSFSIVRYVPQMVISALFIAGYFTMLFLKAYGKADFGSATENLLAVLTLILNFWFGSSHSSQKKDDALAAAAAS